MKNANSKVVKNYFINLPKLPILWKISSGFLLGISSIYLLKNFPSGEIVLVALAFALALLKRKFYFLSSSILGFIFVCLFVANLVEKAPDRSLIGKKISIIGKVDKLYQHQQIYFDFIVQAPLINSDEKQSKKQSEKEQAPLPFGTKIRITWYKNSQSQNSPKTDEVWQLEVKLKQLHSILNPHIKDFTSSKIANSIVATAFVGQNYSVRKIADSSKLNSLRSNWIEKLKASNIEGIKFINALTLGDTSLLENSDWRLFKKTGTLHLWIISGLHLGMVAGFLWLIFGIFTKKKLKTFFALAVVIPILYAILSGWGVAAQRASFMLVVAVVFSAGIRNINVWTSFFLALLIVLLINPLIVLTPGFWLSFGAVASLIFALKARRLGKIRTLLFSQIVVFIVLMPFLYYFAELPSFISPLLNLILIPMITFLLPIAMIGVILYLSLDISWLLSLSAISISYIVDFLNFVGQYALHFKAQNPIFLWFAILAIFPSGFYIRFLGILAFVLTFIKTPMALSDAWTVRVLDVGQGLAVLVEKNHKYLLFDTGINYSHDYAPVIPPLHKLVKSSELDYLIVSHKDKDHSGGQELVLQEFGVWRNIGYKGEACVGAWQEDWEGLKLTFIGADIATENPKNAESCTLLIQDEKQNSALLTGDVLAQQEFEYLPTWQNLLGNSNLSLLLAGHHGSASSSSKELVFGLKPTAVVYSAGFRNYFRHPSKQVIHRFSSIDAMQFNTAYSGALKFVFNDETTKQTTRTTTTNKTHLFKEKDQQLQDKNEELQEESAQAPFTFSSERKKRQYLWDYLQFK